MSVAPRQPTRLEAFLAWEEQQELRWEFDGFEPVAMTGGTAEHSAIQRNLYRLLSGSGVVGRSIAISVRLAAVVALPSWRAQARHPRLAVLMRHTQAWMAALRPP